MLTLNHEDFARKIILGSLKEQIEIERLQKSFLGLDQVGIGLVQFPFIFF